MSFQRSKRTDPEQQDQGNEPDAQELNPSTVKPEAVGEGENKAADQGYVKGCVERQPSEPHERSETHKTQQNDGDLGCQQWVDADQTERRGPDLVEEEGVAPSEHIPHGIEESRVTPCRLTLKHLVPMLEQVHGQPRIAIISHDPSEPARPLTAEEHRSAHTPNGDEFDCLDCYPSPGTA